MKIIQTIAFTSVLIMVVSCKKAENQPKLPITDNVEISNEKLVQKELSYSANGKNYTSFVAYTGDSLQKKPVVFVIPEWWGLNDYAKKRAAQLAYLGYFSVAVDFYGDGKTVDNPKDAGEMATPFYTDAALSKSTFDAAKSELKNFPNADVSKIAVIGYCFGGAQALNMGRQESDLKGVVSFHGNLMTGVKPQNSSVKYLVLNGEADSFVPKEEIDAFKKQMDSAEISYRFINYPGAVHAFTNPAATEIGKKFNLEIAYDKDADEKSWNELKSFLSELFK